MRMIFLMLMEHLLKPLNLSNGLNTNHLVILINSLSIETVTYFLFSLQCVIWKFFIFISQLLTIYYFSLSEKVRQVNFLQISVFHFIISICANKSINNFPIVIRVYSKRIHKSVNRSKFYR